jgi:hypothetical protein
MSEISNNLKGMFYDVFVEIGINPSNTLEGKVASKRRSAQEALERTIMDFEMKYCGLNNEQANQLASESEERMHDIEMADRNLEEIEFAIIDFIDIIESYSREEVYKELHQCEQDVANSKRRARNVKRKALRENPTLSIEEIKNLEIVRLANLERDLAISELKLRIAELDLKLKKATRILQKYS